MSLTREGAEDERDPSESDQENVLLRGSLPYCRLFRSLSGTVPTLRLFPRTIKRP